MTNIIKQTVKILLIVGALSTLFSCDKQDKDITMSQQDSAVDKYLQSQQEAGKRVVVTDGIGRVVLEEGEGEEAAKGNLVTFEYGAYIFSGGKGAIFDTNISDLATSSGLDISQKLNYGEQYVGAGKMIKGLDVGLAGVKRGEHSLIVFSSRHGYGDKSTGLVPKLSPLIFEVWIKDIKKN